MSGLLLALLAATVFFTSLLSGIFGMAGGLILLWALLFLMPVATAIAVHGMVQVVSNGSRAWFTRAYIDWRILGVLCLGTISAVVVLLLVSYRPNIIVISIVIGLMPLLVWLPLGRLQLDATRPSHAFFCGFISGGLAIGVGVSGPIIDISLVRSQIDRRHVIATKAAAQFLNHGTKVAFYWSAAAAMPASDWWAVAVAVPLAVVGTQAGNFVLHRMTDIGFRLWTRWIVTGIGAIYLARGIAQLM